MESNDLKGPYSEWRRSVARNGLKYSANAGLVICEVLRYCYDAIVDMKDEELKDKLTEHLVTAFLMAKSMDKRMRYYKETYNDGTGEAGYAISKIPESRTRLRMRQARFKKQEEQGATSG